MTRAFALVILLTLAACSRGGPPPSQAPIRGGPVALPPLGTPPLPVEDTGAGLVAQGRAEIGLAHWYGNQFHGRRTASGEVFNQNGLTAAHLSLPFGTRVRVTNIQTGQSVVVRINDRHGGQPGVVIDLSREAARRIGALSEIRVRVEVLGR